jgi:hypothetical protein
LRKEDVSFLSMYWQDLTRKSALWNQTTSMNIVDRCVALYLLKCAPGATCRKKIPRIFPSNIIEILYGMMTDITLDYWIAVWRILHMVW